MKRNLLALAVAVAMMLPAAALAGSTTITGEIQGASCITTGYRCPVDRADPYVVLEADFVLLTSGGNYYFLTNLDRAMKARYVGETVRVTGKVTGQAMLVEKFEAKKRGRFKVVWSQKMQREMWEERLRN